MRFTRRFVSITSSLWALLLLAACGGSNPPSSPATSAQVLQLAELRAKVQHVVVIYEENWSFDALYGNYPGANGLSNATNTTQLQCATGTTTYSPLTGNPPALIVAGNPTGPWPCGWQGLSGGAQDTRIPMGMNIAPYALTSYDPPTSKTGDLWHIFWHEQMQIDDGHLETSNGSMDKFAAYASNPGLVMSYYDGTNLPEGKIAQHYTMADNFFHSAFGGSFLNHQWLICACTPQWNQPLPTSNTTTFESYWTPSTKTLNDKNITLMPTPQTGPGPQSSGQYWVVNTTYSVNLPSPGTPADQLLAPIPTTQKTIGDLLTDHSPSLSWKWYSGGWNQAQSNPTAASQCAYPTATDENPPDSGPCFQFHHQPFVYFQRWGSDATARAAHLQDDANYYTDITNQTLPAVSFIKPVGIDNEHPNYSAIEEGQQNVAKYLAALCNSPYWKNTAVIITYDENGGRWDHVTPPLVDQWGPGTRVPAIIVSPYAKAGYVDHTQYETASVLSFIEQVFGLSSLNSRDANATPLSNAFNFSQVPLACQSS